MNSSFSSVYKKNNPQRAKVYTSSPSLIQNVDASYVSHFIMYNELESYLKSTNLVTHANHQSLCMLRVSSIFSLDL